MRQRFSFRPPKTPVEPHLAPYYARIRRRRHQQLHTDHNWLNLLLGAVAAVFLAFVFLCGGSFAAAAAAYGYIASLVPEEIALKPVTVDQSTKIYDRYGNLPVEVFDAASGRRTLVTPDEIPLALKQATIATEDPSFYENSGVDVEGFARAAYYFYKDGRPSVGG